MSCLVLHLLLQQWFFSPRTSGTFVLKIFQYSKMLQKQELLQDIKCLLLLNEQMVFLPSAIVLAMSLLCCHFP